MRSESSLVTAEVKHIGKEVVEMDIAIIVRVPRIPKGTVEKC